MSQRTKVLIELVIVAVIAICVVLFTPVSGTQPAKDLAEDEIAITIDIGGRYDLSSISANYKIDGVTIGRSEVKEPAGGMVSATGWHGNTSNIHSSMPPYDNFIIELTLTPENKDESDIVLAAGPFTIEPGKDNMFNLRRDKAGEFYIEVREVSRIKLILNKLSK